MKNTEKYAERSRWCSLLKEFLESKGEDVGYIASNVLNLPTVTADGEEYEIEITVKIPNVSEDDDCFSKRQAYEMHLAEQAEKKEQARVAKEKKKAKDAALRAKKKAEKEKG